MAGSGRSGTGRLVVMVVVVLVVVVNTFSDFVSAFTLISDMKSNKKIGPFNARVKHQVSISLGEKHQVPILSIYLQRNMTLL